MAFKSKFPILPRKKTDPKTKDESPEAEIEKDSDPVTKTQVQIVEPGRPEETEGEDAFYKQVAIYRPPIDYQQSVKTQIRYAAASSAILMLISLL